MLSRDEIFERMRLSPSDRRRLLIYPAPANIGAISVDLHLSGEILRPHHDTLDSERFNTTTLHSSELALAPTLQWLRMPTDLVGQFAGRSIWARRGLLVATASVIDPTFTGQITVELQNVGTAPLILKRGMAIGQLSFHQVSDDLQLDRSSVQMTAALGIAPDGAVTLFRASEAVRWRKSTLLPSGGWKTPLHGRNIGT